MKRTVAAALLALAPLGCSSSDDSKGKPAKGEGVVVRLGGLRAKTPADWKEEQPSSRMRAYQFRVPGSEPDGDAELVIFSGIGGSAEANIKRWQDMFTPPEGKKPDDAARVTKMKVGGYPALYLDATGTYEDSGMMRPGAPKVKRPNYRMLGVHIEGPEGNYHVLLRGPAATVEKHKKDFDNWLKAFK